MLTEANKVCPDCLRGVQNDGAQIRYTPNQPPELRLAATHERCAIHCKAITACFTGDTKIMLSDGEPKSFEELIDNRIKTANTYSKSINGSIVKSVGHGIEVKGISNKLVRIKLTGIYGYTNCTLDHQFILFNGRYIEAKDLKSGSLLTRIMRVTNNLECDNHISLLTGSIQPKTDIKEKYIKSYISVESVEIYDCEPTRVYCMSVEIHHNFTLENGLITHNCDYDP